MNTMIQQGWLKVSTKCIKNYDLYKENVLKNSFSFANKGHIKNFINSFNEIISNNVK